MKNLARTIAIVLTLLALNLPAISGASATTLSPGDLIKGPGDAVYYYGADAKRYVFPTAKTYATWYQDFSGVKTVALADLQTISLGGNVTYRPGVRLVKVTTDPKTYAVGKGGELRWVKSEAAAAALYGADWNQKVDDLPDPFFINYKIGASIESAADYAPAAESAAVTNINVDKSLATASPAPTTPTSTTPTAPTSTTPTAQSLDFSVSKLDASPGDTLTLSANASDPSGILKIELFFNSSLITTCTSRICSATTQVPTSGTLTSYEARARATTMSNQILDKILTVNVASNNSGLITLTPDHSVIAPSDVYSITGEADISIAPLRIDLYVDNSNVKSCVSVRVCKFADYFVDKSMGSSHPIKAVLTDSLGRTYTSVTSYITVGDPGPTVTVAVANTQIYVGDTLEVTVSASDPNGIAQLELLKDGALLKHCSGPAPCTLITGPWNATSTLIFTGSAVGLDGATSTGVSSPVYVTARP
jgi:hypothetical protein